MISAKIILKDEEHVEIVNTDVHFNSDPNLCTVDFVKRAFGDLERLGLEEEVS